NNPYYEEVRDDLIRYKYDIIFLDYHIESDYLSQGHISGELTSEVLKKELISSRYIDQVLLVDKIEEEITYLKNISDIESSKNRVLAIILAIESLARLALCDEVTLSFVIEDFKFMLDSDELDVAVKELVLDMAQIF